MPPRSKRVSSPTERTGPFLAWTMPRRPAEPGGGSLFPLPFRFSFFSSSRSRSSPGRPPAPKKTARGKRSPSSSTPPPRPPPFAGEFWATSGALTPEAREAARISLVRTAGWVRFFRIAGEEAERSRERALPAIDGGEEAGGDEARRLRETSSRLDIYRQYVKRFWKDAVDRYGEPPAPEIPYPETRPAGESAGRPVRVSGEIRAGLGSSSHELPNATPDPEKQSGTLFEGRLRAEGILPNGTELRAVLGRESRVIRREISLKRLTMDHVRFHNGSSVSLPQDKTVYITRENGGLSRRLAEEFKKQNITCREIPIKDALKQSLDDAADDEPEEAAQHCAADFEAMPDFGALAVQPSHGLALGIERLGLLGRSLSDALLLGVHAGRQRHPRIEPRQVAAGLPPQPRAQHGEQDHVPASHALLAG